VGREALALLGSLEEQNWVSVPACIRLVVEEQNKKMGTDRHHETCGATLRLIVMMRGMRKGCGRSLAGRLGRARVGVIDVVGIRIRLVGIVVVNKAILFLLDAGADC
jgi:hypothetical protein